MKKVLGLLSAVLLFAGTQAYAADATMTTTATAEKVAVVNVQQVLLNSKKVTDANTKLQDQFKPRQEKLAARQKQLQDEMNDFQKKSATMSQKDRDAAEKKLSDEKANFLKDATAFQKEVNEEQNKAMQAILGQLSGVISNLAKKNHYSLVLDSQAVVYSLDAPDITKDVAKEFNGK